MKKKKKNKLDEEYFDYMKTNKDSLNNIIKNISVEEESTINIIHDTIFRVNKIVMHTYNFLKLYILHLYDHNLDFPIIDDQFIKMIMKIVSIRDNTRGPIYVSISSHSGFDLMNIQSMFIKFGPLIPTASINPIALTTIIDNIKM